jgi:osmotically-inducible protein OsmY
MKFLTAQFRSLSTLVILAAVIGGGTAVAEDMRSDADIARAVTTELRYSDIIPIVDMQINVEDGIVTLLGDVPSLTAFRQAEDIAATVRGVRGIVNRAEISMAPDSAGDIRAKAARALAGNPATESYQIEVTAIGDGVLELAGTVDSWAERDLAETIAGAIPGIRSIDNRIEVTLLNYRRGPGEIDAEISERLRWDARVDDSLIAVLVRDGARVSLSGTVGSLAEKRLARGSGTT